MTTMADPAIDAARFTVEQVLREHGLDHLRVRTYGKHLIVHSGAPTDGENRARLTQAGPGRYQLGMADHRGRWESTPYMGTTRELMDILVGQFAFVLEPWE